jgi:hypothetical protein
LFVSGQIESRSVDVRSFPSSFADRFETLQQIHSLLSQIGATSYSTSNSASNNTTVTGVESNIKKMAEQMSNLNAM